MSEVMHWPVRVYYEDTDASGVVYHANYLRYFERARSEWLRARGHGHEVLARDYCAAFTLADISVQYRKPARLDELLTVQTRVAERSRATLIFAQSLWRESELLTEARARVVCVDAQSFKPRAWPPGWLAD